MNTSGLPMVMVTGGAGYIGSHATLALRDDGWPLVVVDNLSTGFRTSVPEDVPFENVDIGSEQEISRVLHKYDVKGIIHFAGSLIAPESVADPAKYYHNNVAKTCSLINAALRSHVRHFVFSSSAAVYGQPEVDIVSEATPLAPINPYGRSKAMVEAILTDVAAAHNLNYCALRYFNVAGADPEGRAGQLTKNATHLIKVAIEAAFGKRSGVDIYGSDYETSDGTGVRDYIHVTDLVNVHIAALKALISNPAESLVLNCGYGRGYSVLDVLDAVDRETNSKIQRRFMPRRPGDPHSLIADNRCLLEKLQVQFEHEDLSKIIRDACNWERGLREKGT